MKIKDILSSKNLYYQIYKTPVSDIYILADNAFLQGVIFKTRSSEKYRIEQKASNKKNELIESCIFFFDNYFNSLILHDIEELNLNLSLFTKNEKLVYKALTETTPGETVSYKKLGDLAGLKNSARFVGNTMAKNIFPIIIPCHRVVKSNGESGNYSAGAEIKTYLINHEKYNAGNINRA